ncbi:helix-turn-helix domain-containing protein [Citrobacter freundii]|jgi:excisionase family DNA binding protein|uniref:helix-turn-helix domain-containing protein n=1 Tax=Citrobacter freundii complex TaxID=1344959 RepID=UPI001BA66D41|nr:helix-turn-helix domain-containing protein [Citrobacter freundii]EBK1991802.1 helix-turn-helix domain-containing protein [Salmonella enterica subsp. enterica serovar Enteritidis]EBL5610245.1 helix-turn-helix domain-containing protein [Salmonella enterica subsp. enterica serovar Typhimurium]EDS4008347.1 helix-turn-helix domain-containing protein [Salmonella enterica subsp. enterica]EIP0538310.1 helix-turn-helix domain-containing protein [Escherichia coli]MBQ5151601.1 helix-turn-helix domain-
MASHSVTEAAKLAGVTRRTIYRHIKAGKLSASVTGGDNTVIETSELLRVYGVLSQPEPEKVSTGSHENQPEYVTLLLAEMSQLREMVSHLSSKVDELQSRLALPAPRDQSVLEWVKERRGKRAD